MSKVDEARKWFDELVRQDEKYARLTDCLELKNKYEQSLTTQREELLKKIIQAIEDMKCRYNITNLKNQFLEDLIESITTIFSEVEHV